MRQCDVVPLSADKDERNARCERPSAIPKCRIPDDNRVIRFCLHDTERGSHQRRRRLDTSDIRRDYNRFEEVENTGAIKFVYPQRLLGPDVADESQTMTRCEGSHGF